MKKYYIHNGTEQNGPFTIAELTKIQIEEQTPIWYEGLDDWTIASEIEELSNLVHKQATDMIVNKKNAQRKPSEIWILGKYISIVCLIFAIATTLHGMSPFVLGYVNHFWFPVFLFVGICFNSILLCILIFKENPKTLTIISLILYMFSSILYLYWNLYWRE